MNDNNKNNILFEPPNSRSNRGPVRNRPPRPPFPPNRGVRPPNRRPAPPRPKNKFIDENLFSDPNLNKAPKPKKELPENFVVIIIAVIIGLVAIGGIIYYFVTREPSEKEPEVVKNKNIFVGSWNCKEFYTEDGTNYKEGKDYILSVAFDNNDKFIYGSYKDLDNNHTIGTYQYELLRNETDDLQIYYLILSSNKSVNNGKIQTGDFKSQYQTKISVKNGNMMLANVKTKDMFACTSHDRTNPKIEG